VRRCKCGFVVAIALLAGAFALSAEEVPLWLKEAKALRPGKFPMPPKAELRYQFGWGDFRAAEAVISIARKGGEWRAKGVGGTTGPVRPVWLFDCEAVSRVEMRGLLSREQRMVEQFRSRSRSTSTIYSAKGVEAKRRETRKGSTTDSTRIYPFQARDLFAAALLIRSQRMDVGDRYPVVVSPGWGIYLVEVSVVAHELRPDGKGGTMPAIRCELNIRRIERDGTLSAFTKFKSAVVWLADDATRWPLRIEASIFVGKVYADKL